MAITFNIKNMTQEILLPRKLANQLLHLAQVSPDQEVCGLISGKNGYAQRCYPVLNVAEHPETQFLLDAQQQITAMTKMRDNGEELFAIYHSHPTAPAQPSITDIRSANYPNALTLIISLNTKGVLDMHCFKIINDSVTEMALVMRDDA